MPPRQASKRRTPVCHAAKTLARPRPRVSWKWPQRRLVAGDVAAPARTSGVTIAADRRSPRCRPGRRASAPASSAACTRRSTSSGSTRPWIVQPNAVLMPTSISAARAARRRAASRMRGDLGHHLVGRLAQVGQAVRVAGRQRQQHRVARPQSIARSAPFRLGTSTEAVQAGQRLRVAPPARRCRPVAAAAWAARTSRPRSRAARRRTPRAAIAACAAVGSVRGRALQAVAQADFAHDHRCAGFRGVGVIVERILDIPIGGASGIWEALSFRSGMPEWRAANPPCDARSTPSRCACSSPSARSATSRAPRRAKRSWHRRSASASPRSSRRSARR